MTVGGIRRHTSAAGGLAQHHGVGAAAAGQLNPGFQQYTPQITMAIGAAGGGRCRGLDGAVHGLLRFNVDSVHYLCYSFVDGVHNNLVLELEQDSPKDEART
jgi:hypothetical protein